MDKQYSIQFFTKFVEAMQKFCRDYLEFEQAVELSGYLSLEIDNYKKERYILSEMVHSTGDVISESYCVKAFKTMKRLPPRNSNSDNVLRDNSNTRRSSGLGSRDMDLQGSLDHQMSYGTRTPTTGYSMTPNRHNAPSNRRPSFAAGGPSQMSEVPNRSSNIAMQIQPRQSQFSSPGMSCDDAVIVSVQTGDGSMGSSVRSSDTAARGQKRNIPQSEDTPIHKKDKLDTDLESLYSAATSIVSTSETDIMKDSYSTTAGPSTSQNDSHNVSETSQSVDVKDHTDSVRLPIPDAVTIKEENDIVFLDSPQDDSNNDFDASQMDSSYGMDDSSHGSQGALGGTAEDQEMNANTARKTKAHVKLFQDHTLSVMRVRRRAGCDAMGSSVSSAEQANKPDPVKGKHYQCEDCDYGTNHLSNFGDHRRIHTGDYIRCHLCPSKFAAKSNYVNHMKVHAGLLKCPVCDHEYFSLCGLHNHQKRNGHYVS